MTGGMAHEDASERSDLIHSFCTEPTHADRGGTDQLSIHDGRWAFCPGGVIASDHRWEPTGGIALSKIASFARARSSIPAGGGSARD